MRLSHSFIQQSETNLSIILLLGRFQWLDFGPAKNLKNYGTIEPPDYDLSLVTAPVYIYYSTNDLLSYEKVMFSIRVIH